jgi:hypothetical protein
MGMKPEQLETAQFKREVAKLKAERPHSALGNLPPAAYAKSALLEFNGTGRCAIPRAPRSVSLHHGAIKAQMTAGLYSSAHETQGSGHPNTNPLLSLPIQGRIIVVAAGPSLSVRFRQIRARPSQTTASPVSFLNAVRTFFRTPKLPLALR